MSTLPGELVLDPFGGSGTTFAVCERKGREWVGSELEFAQEIVDRVDIGLASTNWAHAVKRFDPRLGRGTDPRSRSR